MNRTGKVLLVLALIGVVGMAFRVSWNALRDVAKAVGADATAATLYPIVVDGLMALALVAALVLTDKADKQRALKVLATYTLASLVLNYVHGLVPELHGQDIQWGRLADWDPANWALVLLATSLPVGSIYFGSDLVAKVLHHRPALVADQEESPQPIVNRLGSDLHGSAPEPVPAVAALPAIESGDVAPTAVEPGGPEQTVREQVLEKLGLPVDPTESASAKAVAAVEHPSRRATGRVPQAARTPRPTRTPDELLAEARTVTADWTDGELTAEAIRKAVRTSSANGRTLREALKTERAGRDADASDEVAA